MGVCKTPLPAYGSQDETLAVIGGPGDFNGVLEDMGFWKVQQRRLARLSYGVLRTEYRGGR